MDRRTFLLASAAGGGLGMMQAQLAAAETAQVSAPAPAAVVAPGSVISLVKGKLERLQFDHLGRLRLDRYDSAVERRGSFFSEVQDLGKAGPVELQWVEQWTAPQRWRKHPGNPIYGPHLSGPWDGWTNGVSIIPTADGERYKMYYSGKGSGGVGFAEAQVEDPLTWKENPASPVLTPLTETWEGRQINQPRVVKVTDTHWRMYYTGHGFDGPLTSWAMGMAESFDEGVTWKRYSDKPIIDRGGPDSPDGGGACVPTILRVGDRWMMWYTAGQVNPNNHTWIHLCLAFSDDGIHWEKYAGNPVLTDDFSADPPRCVTSRCYVRHDHEVFRMWYSYARPDYRIEYAESLDGIHWERSPLSPVVGPSASSGWDDKQAEYPEVQIVDGIFRLWFCGNGFGSVGYAEGLPEAGIDLYVRSGEQAEPEDSWTPWQRVERGQAVTLRRYTQVRADLWSENVALSPRLNEIALVLLDT